jgi:ABC-type uncharacterized transport system permease subunit
VVLQQVADYSEDCRTPTPPDAFVASRLYATLLFSRVILLINMQPMLPSLAAACLYAGAALYQGLRLNQGSNVHRALLISLATLGLLLHLGSLWHQMFSGSVLALDFFNAASLVAASVIFLTLLACIRIPVENLLIFMLPLGVITVLLAEFMPTGTTQIIDEEPGILAHILLSLTAYGLLTIAVFQSLLVLLQDYQLKHKRPSRLIKNFPPLQTMESLMFGFLWGGWLLLTLSLVSGALFVQDLFAQHLVHKTFFSLFAWILFAVLLWGRHQLGWRGHKAIRWTLAGFCLLMLAYFGSKLVREFILHI